MASVEKFSDVAVYNQIRHNARKIAHPSNKDILPELSHLNYSLLPNRDGMEAYRYYRERMSQLYVLQRDDVKPLAGWVVTLPREITDAEEQRRFFECAFDFLSERYGAQNVVQAVVHYDEGVRRKVRDDNGKPLYDENGKAVLELVAGQPHLHFLFIPAVPDLNPKHGKAEKVCAKDVLTKRDLRTFHGDLQKYLDEHNVEGRVKTGVTKKNGRNYTVDELKEKEEAAMLREELERLRETELAHDALQQKYDELVAERNQLAQRYEELARQYDELQHRTEFPAKGWGQIENWGKGVTKEWEKTLDES